MREPVGQLGYVWADSPLHRMPAGPKLLGLLVCVVLVALASGPVALTCACAGAAGLVALSRVGWRPALRVAWGLRWFLLAVLVMNALFFGGEGPLLSLGPVGVTAAGLAQGVRIVVRTLLVAVLGALLTATTRPQELVAGVRALLAPLGWLGLPVEAAALAVGVTVQFVPTLLRESRQIMRAQALRCGGVASRGIVRRAVSYVRLLVPIFVSAVRRADELSLAMEARGYRMAEKRDPAEPQPAAPRPTNAPPERKQRP